MEKKIYKKYVYLSGCCHLTLDPWHLYYDQWFSKIDTFKKQVRDYRRCYTIYNITDIITFKMTGMDRAQTDKIVKNIWALYIPANNMHNNI